ncbi:MAG: tRNA (N(6)-L-threonylcarbamoyladenosine(37)-C(2))-methylthiotransferase MtaB [Candidatus Aphodocola sp.]
MKVAIYTLGCKVNTYESEYAISEFIKRGYEIVDFSEFADIYLINTCSVTNTSDQKSRKMIRQARKRNENAVVAVMGCFSQIRENNNAIMDIVDVVIGNNDKSKIVDLIEKFINTKEKVLNIKDISKEEFEDIELSIFNTRTRALVKIEDGCENFCSYCIIPYTRGKVRSKKPERVLKEVNTLVANGYKEIVLTGIHTGHYGADLDNYDFSDLLEDLDKIEGLERIRISSIEIVELNDKFLNILKRSKKIVNHIHIPMQAGSDHVLKLMNRRYDKKYFIDKINKIKTIRPNIAITTDVIVGFPNETEEDFNETIEFVKELKLAGGHVFPFSSRNGTPAAKMGGQLTKQEKHERCKKLIKVFDELEEKYYKMHVGKDVIVIPETYQDGYLIGHTDNYLKVKFKGCEELLGKDVNVLLEKYEDKIMIGRIM